MLFAVVIGLLSEEDGIGHPQFTEHIVQNWGTQVDSRCVNGPRCSECTYDKELSSAKSINGEMASVDLRLCASGQATRVWFVLSIEPF